MSDVMSFTEIYSQHVELLPGRTLLQTTGGILDPVPDDGGRDGTGGVDDNGSASDDGGRDGTGGVDDNGSASDDGGRDGTGGVDDNGPGITGAQVNGAPNGLGGNGELSSPNGSAHN